MLTDQEALAAIDPSLPSEERVELAGRLKGSSAALDAYYDSRPQLEQIIAQAQGHGKVSTFQELNPDPAGKVAGSDAAAIEGEAPVDAEVVPSAQDKEIAELEARVATLKAQKGA